MIYLKKGQKLADNPAMVVYDQTGYYNDGDSIICASAGMPDEPVCRYEAKFIAYGGMVYSISDPDELLAEIIKLDPKSLFGKDSQQVAVDKVVENIVPQEAGVIPPEQTEVTEVVETPVADQNATTTPAVVAPPLDTSTSTTTPTATTTPGTNTGTATTTPDFNFTPGDTSTTTPPFNISTTTPGTFVPIDNGSATTTPPEVLFPDTGISTTTPTIDVPVSVPPTDVSSTTPSIIDVPATVVPPVLDIPAETSTTSEVVAFAKRLVKKKISKKLGL